MAETLNEEFELQLADSKRIVDEEIAILTEYKNDLTNNPDKKFNDRLDQIDNSLATGLGIDMRNHLNSVRAKVHGDGKDAFIENEKSRVGKELLKQKDKKDKLAQTVIGN
jgi:hypothetical protein